MAKTYQQILNELEKLQGDLMNIDDYDEEVYQGFEKTIDAINDVVEEGEPK